MRLTGLLSFTPISVTLITSIVYLSIGLTLVIIHETIPTASTSSAFSNNLNLTEAWLDLQELSNGYHPFNSHRNDEVRDWLLLRIKDILGKAKVDFKVIDNIYEKSTELDLTKSPKNFVKRKYNDSSVSISPEVIVFNDLVSNYTSTTLGRIGNGDRKLGTSSYFEGSNIIVYVRGIKDESCEWWKSPFTCAMQLGAGGGVLINAHFDSVSTGFGATDDGIGVVTILQLIKYITTDGKQPDRGFVALFNNNEEDGNYGAKAFLSHPISSFIQNFLNLEGAGAGGRATLFRSTDMEVTRAYSKSPNPFGSVINSEGFSLGFVKSETDYVVFRAAGYRGLDVAFWKPRSRYHSNEDDTRHTSKSSVWHMLSSSLETAKYLTGDQNNLANSQEPIRKGTEGVWFDLFGRYFAVFSLRALFAWSLTALIISPIILSVVTYFLIRQNRYYLFSGALKPGEYNSDLIPLNVWQEAFRFPVVFIISIATAVGSAFLLKKVNPLIIYSSPYSVWSMFLTMLYCLFWSLMKSFDALRPSALHRLYVLIWMFGLSWILLVAITVFEDQFKVSSGYIFVIQQSTIFLATLIGLFELFALPAKSSVSDNLLEREVENTANFNSEPLATTSTQAEPDDGEEASEEMPLLGSKGHRRFIFPKFSKGYQKSILNKSNQNDSQTQKNNGYPQEQSWSVNLPTWSWILQFLILCPFSLITSGQVGLFLVDATSQTGAEGSPLIFPYLIAAIFSIILLLPLVPFIHRITHHLPIFLIIIFISTLIYNLVSFPFSSQNRYKFYFEQVVNLDTEQNLVTVVGIEEYIREIISFIPSATGKTINCTTRPETRKGLSFCSYEGLPPNVLGSISNETSSKNRPEEWLTFNVTRTPNKNSARFHISGRDTKACAIRFDQEFSAFNIHGAAPGNSRWADIPATGSNQIKLWHRDWDREWAVDVDWPVSNSKNNSDEGRSGRVVCLWSDFNLPGIIPALDEVMRFMPVWATVVKLSDGLVEGSKAFSV